MKGTITLAGIEVAAMRRVWLVLGLMMTRLWLVGASTARRGPSLETYSAMPAGFAPTLSKESEALKSIVPTASVPMLSAIWKMSFEDSART